MEGPIRLQTRRKWYVLLASIFAASIAANAQSSDIPGSAHSADARARRIVRRMTLDEKIQELHGIRDATHFRVVAGIPRLGIPDLNITNGPAMQSLFSMVDVFFSEIFI